MYDIIFLGGGPGGYEGALAAAKKGLKIAVVEADKLGGTCLQRGCIPTKALLHSVKLVKQIKAAAKSGIKVENFSVDAAAVKKQKERVVNKLTKGIELLFKQNNVDLIYGRGKITAADTVTVNEEREIKGKNIVIASGSKPAELPFLKVDGKYIINSDTALELEDIPESMLIIGAGAIGLEMGLIYNYLGCKVTVVEILPHILPGSDIELADMLEKELKKQKVKIFTAAKVSNPTINNEEGSISFDFQQGEKEWRESFSRTLLSVGRIPDSRGLFDESLPIETDKRGFVSVNANLQTGVPTIFACGDVVGPPLLAHKASHQAIAVVDFISAGKPVAHHPIPAAVFTFPEFASVGLTEEEAGAKGIAIKIGRFPYSAGSRSNAIDEKVGLVKIIADSENTLLGAHILGAEAGELLPLLSFAIARGMKAGEFKEVVMIHPTLSENIWEAVGEIGGFSIHI
ncbi:MAG: dihydrolipoyl dehydrogenase [Candidatus Aminicenantes bacterium]|nr:dihydrolipoyl dehydrogenase [Candidatus Aminicenantes bacterium]